MQYTPETLENFADGVQEQLAANILREFAKNWNADRAQIHALQTENTQLQRAANEAKRDVLNKLKSNLDAMSEAA